MKEGRKRIRIAVDLTPMLAGGANGGLRIGNLEFLRGLKSLDRFDFYFLTASATHAEACELLGKDDLLHCVYENRGYRDWRERFFRHMEILATKFQVISDFAASRLAELYRVSRNRKQGFYSQIGGDFWMMRQ